MIHSRLAKTLCRVTSTLLFALVCTAQAQTLISQSAALTGNVTPNDPPGFPVEISQPGRYKLVSNLVVPAGVDGIRIAADDVTLDLNGYSVIGPITCTGSGAAVSCPSAGPLGIGIMMYSSGPRNARVRNGTVRGFANIGVVLSYGSVGEGLMIRANGNVGFWAYANTTLRNSVVAGNGGDGVLFYSGAGHVDGVMIIDNRGYGLKAAGYNGPWDPDTGGIASHLVIARNGGQADFANTAAWTVQSSTLHSNGNNALFWSMHSVRGNVCGGVVC